MIRALLAAGALAACKPPAPAPLRLSPDGAPTQRLLDRLDEAALELPPGALPADAQPGAGLPLADGWLRAEVEGRGPVWVRESPVRLQQKRYPEAPGGARLDGPDGPLPYRFGAADGRYDSPCWEAFDRALYVVSPTDPGAWASPPTLHSPALAASEAALNLASSGLAPLDFARRRLAVDRLTREALLLPAPGRATFTVDLPAGARLRFGWTIVPSLRVEGEGRARVLLRVDGEEAWSAEARWGEPWQEAEVDLGRWAGRTARLELASEPLGDPTRDYVAFGAPQVVGQSGAGGPRRVVVVGIDTLRPDHLGAHGYARPTSPAMDRIAEQSVVFEQAWAPAPRTRPSFRTALTGRWPLAGLESPTLGEQLRDQGFATAGIVANVQLGPRMGFLEGFDWWEYENGQTAEVQVDRALAWLGRHADQDALLFLHLMDPHVYYDAPGDWRDRFARPEDVGLVPPEFNRWDVLAWTRLGKLQAPHKRLITARYDGELAWTSEQLGRLVQALDALPGDTLTVLLSDHGEELWEHGGFEHNHALWDEVVRVLLWVRPPGGLAAGVREAGPASLADLAPTLLDLLGTPAERRPPTDGLSLAALLGGEGQADATRAAQAARALPLGHLMYDREQWGVVADGHKYLLRTATGEEQLYDLREDPGEQRDLAVQAELAPWRARLAEATGFPVHTGWRLELRGLQGPVRLRFERPVIDAGVVDPEAESTRRANPAWGQPAEHQPQDVAAVSLSEDRRTVLLAPGPWARGVVWIAGPGPEDRAVASSETGEIGVGVGELRLADSELAVRWGALIDVQEREADHWVSPGEAEADDSLEALQQLGYVEAEDPP